MNRPHGMAREPIRIATPPDKSRQLIGVHHVHVRGDGLGEGFALDIVKSWHSGGLRRHLSIVMSDLPLNDEGLPDLPRVVVMLRRCACAPLFRCGEGPTAHQKAQRRTALHLYVAQSLFVSFG